MVRVVVGVDQVGHLVAHAVGLRDLVDRSLEVVPDARRCVEEDDAVLRRQEGGLIDAIGDPVEVPLDASDVVALLVEGGPERRLRDRRVVGQGVGRSGVAVVVVSEVLIDRSFRSSGQFAQGREKAPSWLPIAAMSSNAHCSLILPSSVTR